MKFDKPWNVTGKTWIEADVPGPWAVDNSRLNSWGIINTETGRSKVVGPVVRPRWQGRVNYFDRAMELANKRNVTNSLTLAVESV